MTTRDPIPDSKELERSAIALHDVMADLFDRQERFNPLYYSISFDFSPKPAGPLHLPGGVRSKIERSLDLNFCLDRDTVWRLGINYQPKSESLGVSQLAVPVSSDDNKTAILHLVRFDPIGAFLPLIQEQDSQNFSLLQTEVEKLEAMVYDRNTTTALDESLVNTLIDEAGIKFDGQEHPQQWLTPALDSSSNWQRTEHIVSPIAPDGSQVRLERTHFFKESYSENGRSTDSGGRIELCNELVDTDGERRQVLVTYNIDDYNVCDPNIVIRTLKPSSSPSEVANNGPFAYTVCDEESVKATPELLDLVHEDFLNAYGDIA